MTSVYNSSASARLAASIAAAMVKWLLDTELERCSPKPSRASESSLLSLSAAPRNIQSLITPAEPQSPCGSRAAPAGRQKENAADRTLSIGSARMTIPFFNTHFSIFSVIAVYCFFCTRHTSGRAIPPAAGKC